MEGCYFFFDVVFDVFGYKMFVVNLLDFVVMGVELCVFMFVCVLLCVDVVWFEVFSNGLFVLVE